MASLVQRARDLPAKICSIVGRRAGWRDTRVATALLRSGCKIPQISGKNPTGSRLIPANPGNRRGLPAVWCAPQYSANQSLQLLTNKPYIIHIFVLRLDKTLASAIAAFRIGGCDGKLKSGELCVPSWASQYRPILRSSSGGSNGSRPEPG